MPAHPPSSAILAERHRARPPRLGLWALGLALWSACGQSAGQAPSAAGLRLRMDLNTVSAPTSVANTANGSTNAANTAGATNATGAQGLTPQPVRLAAAGRALGELQRQIETALGVRLVLSGNAAQAVVNGDVSGNDGLAFVRQLAGQLRLAWALGPGEVYLGEDASARSTVFSTPSPAVANRVASLASKEFEGQGSSIRFQAKREELEVSGLPGWMGQVASARVPALIDEVAGRMQKPQADEPEEALSLLVYPLNNAYVDDKRLNVGSTTLVIPGVARLFRQFTGMPGTDQAGGTAGPTAITPTTTRLERESRLEPSAGGRAPRNDRNPPPEPEPTSEAVAAQLNRPAVLADTRMNLLVIRDRPHRMEGHRTLLKTLDQPANMVQLDAFVIDIKASRLEEFGLGLSWQGSGTFRSSGFGTNGAAPANSNVILQAARGAQLLMQIRALEAKGDSEVLTVPSVVTLNNLEATFSARDNFYVRVTGNQDASLTRVTAETLLRVTPLVGNAPGDVGERRRIRLLISVQDGQIDASSSAVVDNLPRVLENQISTQAVVRGGDTLVIGGQVVRKRINRSAELPGISKIPILGALTSARSEDVQSYVRIYMVRPRILSEDGEPTAANTTEPQVFALPAPPPPPAAPPAATAPEPARAAPVISPALPAPTTLPAAGDSGARRWPDAEQRQRDAQAKPILERELRQALDTLAQRESEVAQGRAGAQEALLRSRTDVDALRRELQRLDGRMPTVANSSPATR